MEKAPSWRSMLIERLCPEIASAFVNTTWLKKAFSGNFAGEKQTSRHQQPQKGSGPSLDSENFLKTIAK